jgi:hypothetical protein
MRRPLPFRVTLWLPLGAVLLGTSCGGGLNSVTGKVHYNGQPAAGAVVVFHPVAEDTLTTLHPTGVTAADGSFTLTTRTDGDGAAAGEYLVTVVWPEPAQPRKPGLMSTEPPPDPPDRLRGRYANRATSDLRAVVQAGRNVLPPFELK